MVGLARWAAGLLALTIATLPTACTPVERLPSQTDAGARGTGNQENDDTDSDDDAAHVVVGDDVGVVGAGGSPGGGAPAPATSGATGSGPNDSIAPPSLPGTGGTGSSVVFFCKFYNYYAEMIFSYFLTIAFANT
jgi:hypothetical protein